MSDFKVFSARNFHKGVLSEPVLNVMPAMSQLFVPAFTTDSSSKSALCCYNFSYKIASIQTITRYNEAV